MESRVTTTGGADRDCLHKGGWFPGGQAHRPHPLGQGVYGLNMLVKALGVMARA